MDRYIGNMGEDAKFFTEGTDALTNRARLRTAIKRDMVKAKAVDFLVNLIEPPAKAEKPAKAKKTAAADKPAAAKKPVKKAKEDKS